MTAPTRRSLIRHAVGSVSWATTAQVLSAASNFVVTIAVARGTGLEGLGRFSIAFAAYLTVLGFSRSLISEPLLARRGPGDGREAEAASVTLTLLFSLAGAAVVGGTGLALGRLELVVAGAALPVTLLHDLLRYHAFGRERPELAARLDGGWLLGSLLLWPVLTNSSSAAVAVLCWAGAAVLGIALGWAPLLPRLLGARAAFRWWRRHARGLAGPLVLDSLLVTMALQTTVVIITAVSGDSALGLLRAGQVYFAPLGIMFTAIGLVAIPWLARGASVASVRVAGWLSAGQAALATVACLLIILARPLLETVLFDDAIAVPVWLLVPIMVQVVASAAGGGFIVLCKARGLGRDIARSRLCSTVIGTAAIVALTLAFGLAGAVWAIAAQGVLHTALLAVRVVRSPAPAGEPLESSENSDVHR